MPDSPTFDFPPYGSDDYIVDRGCIALGRMSFTRGFIRTPLCNFTATIVEELTFDDGAHIQRELVVEGRSSKGELFPRVQLTEREFNQMTWVFNHWGARAIVKARAERHLRLAIPELSPGMLTRDIYAHSGWRLLGGRPTFFTASGPLLPVAPGHAEISESAEEPQIELRPELRPELLEGLVAGRNSPSVSLHPSSFILHPSHTSVELPSELEHYYLPRPLPAGSDQLRQAVRASLRFLDLAPLPVSLPLWAAMYLAPLAGFIPPRFMLWLVGAGSGIESELAAHALCHFGTLDLDDLLSWSGDAADLEYLAFVAKDIPLVLAGFLPDAAGRDPAALGRLVAAILREADDSSESARPARGLPHPLPARGLLISAADTLPGGLAVLSHLIAVEFSGHPISRPGLSAARAGQASYAQAMAGYLAWLAPRWHELPDQLYDRLAEYRGRARRERPRIPHSEGIASLMVAFDLALRFAVSIEALTAPEAEALRARGWRTLLALGRRQPALAIAEQPEVVFLTILVELLNLHRVRLAPLDPPAKATPASDPAELPSPAASTAAVRPPSSIVQPPVPHPFAAAVAPLIGWSDAHYIYLLPDLAYQHVAEHARASGRRFGHTSHAIRKALVAADLLITDDGHLTTRLKIAGLSRRVLKLSREAFEDIVGGPLPKSGHRTAAAAGQKSA